jgi:hypothetical protein
VSISVTIKREDEMQTKLIFIFSLLLPFFSVSAKDWNIKGTNDGFSLVGSNYSPVELELEGPFTPQIIKPKKHSLFDVIIVDHGEVGTSCLVRIHKAYVFNKAESKFVGVYPYRVIAVDNKVKKCAVKPIVWEFYKTHILIHDKNTDQKFKLNP